MLLAVVRLDDAAYGVTIAQELTGIAGRELSLGSVYAALERLSEKGLVKSRLGNSTPERGGRAKRYFQPTAAGWKALKTTRQALTSLWRGLPQLEGGRA